MHGRVQYAYTVYTVNDVLFIYYCVTYTRDMGDLKLKYVNGEKQKKKKKIDKNDLEKSHANRGGGDDP